MKEALLFIKKYINDNDTVVIGESGGPDSMCLLFLLMEYRKSHNINIVAAHVNHSIRAESDNEQIFVENYCKKNNIIFDTMKIEKSNFELTENKAREIRYEYFKNTIKKYNAKFLLTAHHGDDLMETILMRLTRGSSLKGYAGFEMHIKYRDYILLRPLIYYTKQEIKEYADKNNIPYVVDKSNEKTKYTRNRYRKYALPFFKEENINSNKKFLNFSNKLLEACRFIDDIVNDTFKNVYINKVLYVDKFNDNKKIVKTRIIEKILNELYPDDLFIINDCHVNLIMDAIKSNKKNIIVNLPHNMIMKKEYNKIYFEKNNESNKEYNIELQEETYLNNGYTLKLIDKSDEKSNFVTRLNLDEIELPLYARTKSEGDKISVKKLNGSKKVKDIFIDSKITKSQRDSWPILVDSLGKVLWIPGLKKSKFDKEINEKYDIIIKYE